MNLKKIKKALLWGATLTLVLSLGQSAIVLAANRTTFSQTINDGVQSVDIVDANGSSIATPGVNFNNLTFSFENQTATGMLGSANGRIRILNPTGDTTWSVSLAATNGATALWSNGTSQYDFNDLASGSDGTDLDSVGGQMTINPSASTLVGVSGCNTANVNRGSSAAFTEGTVNSITLLTGAAGAATYCRWELTNIGLTQIIPGSQPSGAYTLDLTLTIA